MVKIEKAPIISTWWLDSHTKSIFSADPTPQNAEVVATNSE
jgi:hypothetical protein